MKQLPIISMGRIMITITQTSTAITIASIDMATGGSIGCTPSLAVIMLPLTHAATVTVKMYSPVGLRPLMMVVRVPKEIILFLVLFCSLVLLYVIRYRRVSSSTGEAFTGFHDSLTAVVLIRETVTLVTFPAKNKNKNY